MPLAILWRLRFVFIRRLPPIALSPLQKGLRNGSVRGFNNAGAFKNDFDSDWREFRMPSVFNRFAVVSKVKK